MKSLVFVRIQKTGSKSLVSVLEQCSFTMCAKRAVDAVESVACEKSLRHAVQRNLRVADEFACYVASHCPLSAFEQEVLRPPTRGIPRTKFVATIVREPVARVVSEYRHVCAKGRGQWDYSTHAWRSQRALDFNFTATKMTTTTRKSYNHPKVVVDCENSEAFSSFVSDPSHANGMQNRQTKMLGGARLIVGTPDPTPDRILFERAMKGLLGGYVDVALVFERFHLSLLVLSAKLQLPAPREFSVISEAVEKAPKPRLDGAATDLVARLNSLDSQLHGNATLLLSRTASILGIPPDREYYRCVHSKNKTNTTTTEILFSRQDRNEHHYFQAASCRLVWTAPRDNSTSLAAATRAARRPDCEARLRKAIARQRLFSFNRTMARRYLNRTRTRRRPRITRVDHNRLRRPQNNNNNYRFGGPRNFRRRRQEKTP
ncbi:hypothetical protein CTAYLR_004970 [Chrysophaeum taylorii]|uniref:Uncharacterized protein n=1 Tax=Chrysophaeum taylorii TaxID=2483200 RepID=A0AAD7XQY6_9STRA|nr:hypothetical protein CTAYLR_004970 [Chrysophaeum taylorii]